MQAAEVDVAGGDREHVPIRNVLYEKGECRVVAAGRRKVVEDVRSSVHATGYRSAANRVRTRSR